MLSKNFIFISSILLLILSFFSYAATTANNAASSKQNNLEKQSTSKKQWLFVLSADKGRILKAKNNGTYELSLTHIDKGVIAITNEPFRETKIIPSITFLKNFTTTFANAAPNAILTHSGLLTGKKSLPIAIVIQSVTVIPDIKVMLSLHPLSSNIKLPEGDIREVKLFIDAGQTPGPGAY